MTAPVRETIDWPAIAGTVARALCGEPSSRTRTEMRFGRRGSLSVKLDSGTWFDHEADEGGGVVALVERERRCSTREALEWLESAGFVDSAGKRGPESAHTAFSRGRAVGEYPPRKAGSGPWRPCGAWWRFRPVSRPGHPLRPASGARAAPVGRCRRPGSHARARVPGQPMGMAPGRGRRRAEPAPGRAMAAGRIVLATGPGSEAARTAGGRVRGARLRLAADVPPGAGPRRPALDCALRPRSASALADRGVGRRGAGDVVRAGGEGPERGEPGRSGVHGPAPELGRAG